MMTDLVYAQAALLAGQLDAQQTELLKLLCQAAVSCLEARLREGITPEACKADFVAAASLYALSGLREAGGSGGGIVVGSGTPEQLAENPDSHTGAYLKKILSKQHI